MATIKSFTSLEQSRKLVEILPLESADMCYQVGENLDGYLTKTIYTPLMHTPYNDDYVPCWSLSALLGVLPDEITDDGDVYRNMFFHLKDKYIIQYPRLTTLWPSLLSVEADNPIDVCVTMIEKLNELKML